MIGDAIFDAVFTGFFFFGGLAALILGLTAPTHDPAVAAVSGLAAGGGAFGMVFLAGPFLEALEDLWWAMGYSSGMLFTGRCKHHWSDKRAPADWVPAPEGAGLLRARDLAGELFTRAYIPSPAWLCLAFGYGTLVLTVSTAIATLALVVLPGNRYAGTAALVGDAATMGWVITYAIFLGLHHSRFRRDWDQDETLAQKAVEVVEILGGWGNLGHRITTNCAGARRFAPGPWVTVFGLTVSLATTLAIRLWPYRYLLALSAAAALALFALAVAVWWHIRSMHQALHPKRYSPCVSLPLALLLRDAAKRRDRSAPWI